MNTEHKEKVKRWNIVIKHYDFDVQHILGKFSVEADAWSRLVPLPTDETEVHTIIQTDTIVKPSKLDPRIYDKIKQAHNDLLGHDGVRRTLNILTEKLNMTRKGLRNDVSTFVERCSCCQKMKHLKPQIHTIQFTLAAHQPIKRICVDAIGPIHKEGQEYKHLRWTLRPVNIWR